MSADNLIIPQQEAEQCLINLNIRSIPVPIDKVARGMGAQVRYSPLDEELSGMIYVKDNIPIIGVNSLHHPNRQRFTIAHELGHLVLHKPIITSSIHVDKQYPSMSIRLNRDVKASAGTDAIEMDANAFASALLMPAEALLAALPTKLFDIDDDGPLSELAKRFRVSRQTLEYRIQWLLNEENRKK